MQHENPSTAVGVTLLSVGSALYWYQSAMTHSMSPADLFKKLTNTRTRRSNILKQVTINDLQTGMMYVDNTVRAQNLRFVAVSLLVLGVSCVTYGIVEWEGLVPVIEAEPTEASP